ncbi:MAG: hypothetical protein CM1200mP26_11350 [Acidimicrobiales bacterium]|nr:MAG: hypothetical protein CM1200mP26_11350 [Acidimicrobiales bacterium]
MSYGEKPSAAFWAHAYDATTLLLEAIDAASYVDEDGALVIDRAGVREWLNGVTDYEGMIGTLSCDEFGDCGSQKITVIGHADSGDTEGIVGQRDLRVLACWCLPSRPSTSRPRAADGFLAGCYGGLDPYSGDHHRF